MNPWLERPNLWGSIHARLVVALADDLNPRLRPTYQAEVEEMVYVVTTDNSESLGRPDVSVRSVSEAQAVYAVPPLARPVIVETPQREEIKHRWLEIRDLPAKEVITVVEILSPVNKRPGEGREKYEEKRNNALASRAHLVEIDLLRAYGPMPVRWPGESQPGENQPGDYRLLVSRVGQRPRAELYPFTVRDPVPLFRLPLRADDDEPMINLGLLLQAMYARANYDLTIDYGLDPDPPLSPEDAAWAKEQLKLKT